MLDTIAKLFLQYLHPLLAVPLAVVVAALALSLVGKLKSLFDKILTAKNAAASVPCIARIVAVAHATLGIIAALWCYFQTDLFSPPVDPKLTHPLGREFIRRTDWMLIMSEAFLYLPLIALLSRQNTYARLAATIFILAVIPTAAFVAIGAVLYPGFLSPNPAPLSLWAPTGSYGRKLVTAGIGKAAYRGVA